MLTLALNAADAQRNSILSWQINALTSIYFISLYLYRSLTDINVKRFYSELNLSVAVVVAAPCLSETEV